VSEIFLQKIIKIC